MMENLFIMHIKGGVTIVNTVIYTSEQGISTIYLNRPKLYNALNQEMLQELLTVIEEVEKNDDLIVILTGKGPAFCAGGDIGMMEGFAEKSFFDDVMGMISQIVSKLYMMPKIVISAVQGPAAGLGLSLALTADYVIAHKEAKLGMLFLGVGLVPDGGGHFWLEERMGTHQAKQFIWSMKQVQGEQARSMGLVDSFVEHDVMGEVKTFGKKLLASPLQAIIKTKMVYHSGRKGRLQSFLESEQQAQWKLRQTDDHKEGVRAFMEKRKPMFTGK